MSIVTRVSDLATRVATDVKGIRTLVNGNVANLAGLNFGAKTNIVAALNELHALIVLLESSGGAVINDASVSSATQTYSINKILALMTQLTTDFGAADVALKAEILGGVGGAYDTLIEIQDKFTDLDLDLAGFLTNISNRLRFDMAQTLTAPQKAQVCANAGALSLVQSGDPDTNFVTVFEAGLV